MVNDQLMAKQMQGGWKEERTRTFLIYSLADCERNYRQYCELRKVRDSSLRRPRAHINLRAPALRRLATVEPILYSDAIGSGEAADILKCHATLIQQLVASGKLIAKKAVVDKEYRHTIPEVPHHLSKECRKTPGLSDSTRNCRHETGGRRLTKKDY